MTFSDIAMDRLFGVFKLILTFASLQNSIMTIIDQQIISKAKFWLFEHDAVMRQILQWMDS